MPMAYFKCQCGKETRKIVPIDHSRDVWDEKKQRWFYDPKSKAEPADMYPNETTCECGQTVKQSADPKGVKTKFLFNYLADD